jgi:hypothetical protein
MLVRSNCFKQHTSAYSYSQSQEPCRIHLLGHSVGCGEVADVLATRAFPKWSTNVPSPENSIVAATRAHAPISIISFHKGLVIPVCASIGPVSRIISLSLNHSNLQCSCPAANLAEPFNREHRLHRVRLYYNACREGGYCMYACP